ncbi:MAG TPA: hypothetical protein VH684_31415 [Xanthobacteraceae bacterium]|jgi:hypothetical protein
MQSPAIDPLDVPIWGAKQIGQEAHLFDQDGNIDERRAFYLCQILLKEGIVSKAGGRFFSTPRRLRNYFAGKAVQQGQAA